MTAADAPVLVTGGAGFIGCNVVDRLAAAGERVIVYDNLSRDGVEQNAAWLPGKLEAQGYYVFALPATKGSKK